MDDMNTTIKQAYAYIDAIKFFQRIDKDFVLEWYTKLDYLYSVLSSIGIVDIYNGHAILKPFRVVRDKGQVFIIAGEQWRTLSMEAIMGEIFDMYEKPEN